MYCANREFRVLVFSELTKIQPPVVTSFLHHGTHQTVHLRLDTFFMGIFFQIPRIHRVE